METPKIRYNLNDRGRKYTGQARAYNIQKLCDAINSPATQEIVATGGMIGYLGHMPRVRYGLAPVEGGIENGKYAPVEPAFVTTYLHAAPNGDVTHKARFLNTQSGILAKKLWDEKIGGFSSAIDTGSNQFFGFDFVHSPNFLQNSFRGVVLDSTSQINPLGMTYDDILEAEARETQAALAAVLDSMQMQRDAALATIDHLRAENESLLSQIASRPAVDPVKPYMTPKHHRLLDDAQAFRHASLEPIREQSTMPPEFLLFEKHLNR